jgi:two-component system, NarL family, sensor kinase
MSGYERVEELNIMKVIAETLNRCNDLTVMLQTVLEKLLELTKLEAGWVFLVDGQLDYQLAAYHGLPPALSWEDHKPMCSGDCYCLSRYRNGKLKEPVNIIECKRLNDAIQKSWGETNGITHHATIPLGDGADSFGLLNVASPRKEKFSEEELTLLQSLGYQIGTAIRRTRLYQEEQRRAENYEKLNELMGTLWSASDLGELANLLVEEGHRIFHWSSASFYIKEEEAFILIASGPKEDVDSPSRRGTKEHPAIIAEQVELAVDGAIAKLPMIRQQQVLGMVWLRSPQQQLFQESDKEMLEALARHLSLVYESIALQEKRQELLLHEERKRLARDLHDSVNQKLFSLSLSAKGAKEIVGKYDASLGELMDDMWLMSQKSLKEMRSLIWQLRPVGLEEGLLSAMEKYAEHLDLNIHFDVERLPDWPRQMEETLWRIGQEAMNNVSKHAKVKEVTIRIYETKQGIGMQVSDEGDGFNDQQSNGKQTLGLTSMKERTVLLQGNFSIKSEPGSGTTVEIFLPYKKRVERGINHEN